MRVISIEIVEDETSQRKVLADKFSLLGYHVVEARDGEEGLNLALAQKPDVMLIDILMPKMDGFEMLRKIRQANDWGRKVPVIILTNLSPDDEKTNNEIAESEPSYYLTKSATTIEEIVEKVKEQFR